MARPWFSHSLRQLLKTFKAVPSKKTDDKYFWFLIVRGNGLFRAILANLLHIAVSPPREFRMSNERKKFPNDLPIRRIDPRIVQQHAIFARVWDEMADSAEDEEERFYLERLAGRNRREIDMVLSRKAAQNDPIDGYLRRL